MGKSGQAERERYKAVIWGCAALMLILASSYARSDARRVKGAVPAVGGYSNTRKSDSPTVGIVTLLHGSGFAVPGKNIPSRPLHVGAGLQQGQEIWVEQGSSMRVATVTGVRFRVSGPAVFQISSDGVFHLQRGSVWMAAADDEKAKFETPLLKGEASGTSAIWFNAKTTQAFALQKDLHVWHPLLPEAKVLVAPGTYSESTPGTQHLQPKRPEPVDPDVAEEFLERFGEDADQEIDFHEAIRKLASDPENEPEFNPADRGSRTPAEVTTPSNPAAMARLKAHITGMDLPDEDEEAPLVSKHSQRSSRRAKLGSHGAKPSFELKNTGDTRDPDAQGLLQKLSGKKGAEP